ncbi:hypothetical protein [Maribellus sediminis]|uniref:hypothetical protein n=1 Tax=Maribellus sediminis TaxID=2696285 RepID=UPI0014301ACA|nr:hypothetical protein [Maribellus sediminis]
MEILKVILFAFAVLAVGIFGIAVRIVFLKGGKFVNTHVGGNKYLKRQKIHCAQTQDKMEQRDAWRKVKFNNATIASDIKVGK